MDPSSLRSFRDFLLQYNRVSQACFEHCVDHLTDRDLSQNESRCVDMCTKKHVSVNHKVMQVYMEIQPQIMSKRMEELEKQQQQAALEAGAQHELEESKKSTIMESSVETEKSIEERSELNLQVDEKLSSSETSDVGLRTS